MATETKVTITNEEAYGAVQAINSLSGKELAPALALRIVKIRKAITAHLEDVESIRKKVIDDCAEKDGEGKQVQGEQPGTIKLKQDLIEKFKDNIRELMDQTVDLGVAPLKIGDFIGVTLSPATIEGLGSLLVE